jgi:hypothetical protein
MGNSVETQAKTGRPSLTERQRPHAREAAGALSRKGDRAHQAGAFLHRAEILGDAIFRYLDWIGEGTG